MNCVSPDWKSIEPHQFEYAAEQVFELPVQSARAGVGPAVKNRPTPMAVAAVLSPSPRNLRRDALRSNASPDLSRSGFWTSFRLFIMMIPFVVKC